MVSLDLNANVLVPMAVGAAVGLSKVTLLVDEEHVATSTVALSSVGRESSASERVGAMSIVVLLDVTSTRTDALEI